MNRTITQAEMDSRVKVAQIESAFTDALSKIVTENGATYGELILGISRVMVRWSERNWLADWQEDG